MDCSQIKTSVTDRLALLKLHISDKGQRSAQQVYAPKNRLALLKTHRLDKQQRNSWRVYAPDHPVGEKMHIPDNNIVALENM